MKFTRTHLGLAALGGIAAGIGSVLLYKKAQTPTAAGQAVAWPYSLPYPPGMYPMYTSNGPVLSPLPISQFYPTPRLAQSAASGPRMPLYGARTVGFAPTQARFSEIIEWRPT